MSGLRVVKFCEVEPPEMPSCRVLERTVPPEDEPQMSCGLSKVLNTSIHRLKETLRRFDVVAVVVTVEERESAWRAAELGSINDGKSLTPEIDWPIVKACDKIADH